MWEAERNAGLGTSNPKNRDQILMSVQKYSCIAIHIRHFYPLNKHRLQWILKSRALSPTKLGLLLYFNLYLEEYSYAVWQLISLRIFLEGNFSRLFMQMHQFLTEASRYLSLLPNFVEVPETRSSRIIPFEDSDEEDRKIMVRGSGVEIVLLWFAVS